jgi:hypothetical protein
MEGWIKLHRIVLDHWIWSNEKYFKAWIWFLIRANHKSNKILIGSELVELKRGEFITSIFNIAEHTSLTTRGVRTFLQLLENDGMIIKKSTSKRKTHFINHNYIKSKYDAQLW